MLLHWEHRIDRLIRKQEAARRAADLTRLEWGRLQEDQQYPNAKRIVCVNCGYDMLGGYLSCHSCGHDFRVKIKLGPWIPYEMQDEIEEISREKFMTWYMGVEIPRLLAEERAKES